MYMQKTTIPQQQQMYACGVLCAQHGGGRAALLRRATFHHSINLPIFLLEG